MQCYNNTILNNEAIIMFKIPTGKELDQILDELSNEDCRQIRDQFEKDVAREDLINSYDETRD